MTLSPRFTLSDIRLTVGDHEYKKWLDLYEKRKVLDLVEDELDGSWSANVQGTSSYLVEVPVKNWEYGSCDCYIGERGEICKHLIALSIGVVRHSGMGEEVISEDIPLDVACCSGEIRDMTVGESESIKTRIQEAMKYIKWYDGPSSTWFRYQNKLDKGSRLFLALFSEMPICHEAVDICTAILKRLDKKLSYGGVDDSNGTIWGAMEQMVELLCLMSDLHPLIVPYILKKLPKWECWGWDESYREMYQIGYQRRKI